jgi:hypothetical protein
LNKSNEKPKELSRTDLSDNVNSDGSQKKLSEPKKSADVGNTLSPSSSILDSVLSQPDRSSLDTEECNSRITHNSNAPTPQMLSSPLSSQGKNPNMLTPSLNNSNNSRSLHFSDVEIQKYTKSLSRYVLEAEKNITPDTSGENGNGHGDGGQGGGDQPAGGEGGEPPPGGPAETGNPGGGDPSPKGSPSEPENPEGFRYTEIYPHTVGMKMLLYYFIL